MLRTVFIIGTGGFIGSVLRFLVQIFVERNLSSTFPYGTLVANIAGSFLIGIVYALTEKGTLMSPEWRIFMAVGLCGGFTTFSSFSYNNFTMISEQTFLQLILNIGSNIFLGIIAVYLGVILIRIIY
jgi:fluoride exporter